VGATWVVRVSFVLCQIDFHRGAFEHRGARGSIVRQSFLPAASLRTDLLHFRLATQTVHRAQRDIVNDGNYDCVERKIEGLARITS
jgi:hypothetical protein